MVPFGVAVLEFYPTFQPWIGETLPRLMTWFTPGMAIAVVAAWAKTEPAGDGPVTRFARTVAQSAGACWLIGGMIFIIACTPLSGPETLSTVTLWQTEIKLALYALVAVAIVAPTAFQAPGPTWVSMVLGNPVMRYLGKISYGVFLWQFVVIYGFFAALHLRNALQGGSFTLVSATAVLIAITAVTVATATLSYYLIENPAQRLYRLIGPRRASRHRRVLGGTETQGTAGTPGQQSSAAEPTMTSPAESPSAYRKYT